jgi:pyruvate/2-oxoglutarate/acetoin dehydrogenase E1 component
LIPWISYEEAITEALRVEMRHDPNLVCMASRGSMSGATGPTDELLGEFGSARVQETSPFDAMLSAAVAGASEGLRPVCEVELTELVGGGEDALAEAARSIPLTLRVVWGVAAERSMAEGLLDRCLRSAPSAKVVAPATASDAKGLLVSAIRDPGPVFFLECRDLYRSVSDAVPEGDHTVSLGVARGVASGVEMTLIAHGPAVVAAELAAGRLGGAVGLVDLRTLRPLDRGAISSCVRDTGKILIAEAADAATRIEAEVENVILEEAPEYLDAPLRYLPLPEPSAGSAPNGEWVRRTGEACSELIAF